MSQPAPLRILMGVPKPGIPGGPQGHLPHLVHGLRARGLTVYEELYGNPDGRSSFWQRAAFVLKTARRLRSTLRREPVDVVHLNTAFDLRALLRDLVVLFCLPHRRAKVVLKFHGTEAWLVAPRNPFLRLLVRLLLRRIAAAGVLSTEERENFLRAGFPPAKIVVVKNILVPGAYRTDPSFREREKLEPDAALLLFSGRLLKEKGLIEIIRAIPLVQSKGGKVLLLCCGDGPVRGEAAAEAERLQVSGAVHMYGHLPEERMREFYANADMLVLPTYHQEGFPMAVFQSVAAGLPVITTRIRASADYLQEPVNCLWTDPRDPGMLADRILALIRDPALRSSMAEANRRLAVCFTEEKVAGEFVALYDRLARA